MLNHHDATQIVERTNGNGTGNNTDSASLEIAKRISIEVAVGKALVDVLSAQRMANTLVDILSAQRRAKGQPSA